MLRALPSPVLKALKDAEYTVTLGNCLTVLMGQTFVLLSGVYLSFQFVLVASHSPCTTVNSVAPSLPPTGISRLLVGSLKPSLPQAQQVQLPQPLLRASPPAPSHLGEPLLSLLHFIAFPKQSDCELSLPMRVRLKTGMALHTKKPEDGYLLMPASGP